ncbi:hypothetical protein Fmac_027839 [Flemingia macrophylla]|uniref:Uncharacterized protein n=1 Tax=Flemingia macrophylla TaxID=520843 RepID=A0ABD1LIV7_9FABA
MAAPPTTAVTPPFPASASPPRAQPRTTAGGCFDQRLRARPTRSPTPPTTAATPPPPSSASPSRTQAFVSLKFHLASLMIIALLDIVIGLDGIRMLDPNTSQTLRIYPLENITRCDRFDSSTFAFWSKSHVDIEPRRIRLQSNSYTTNTLLDTVTAATIQPMESEEASSKPQVPTQLQDMEHVQEASTQHSQEEQKTPSKEGQSLKKRPSRPLSDAWKHYTRDVGRAYY